MHFQNGEFAQAKLVRVVKGAVLDVVVDNRKDSKNYGKYYEYLLTEENHYQLFVPRGFAHGFLCLRDDTIFQYKCDNLYNKESEDSFKYDSFGFDWTKYLSIDSFIVSAKDENAKPFNSEEVVEIPKEILLKKIDELSKQALTKAWKDFDISYFPFKEDIYADVRNPLSGKVSRAKLIYTSPYIVDFSDIASLNMGGRHIVCKYDNGHEFALSSTFDEVIRFYKYK